MKKIKILIVTYDWMPRNAVSVHRPYSWAKNWSDADIKVHVFTAKKKDFDRPFGLNLPELKDVTVTEADYNNLGKYVSFIVRIPFIRQFTKKIKNLTANFINKNIDLRRAWAFGSSKYFKKLANEFDVVVSTYPPTSAHLIAWQLKKLNPNIYWVADYRDLWSSFPDDTISSECRNAMLKEEIESVGKNADLISVAAEDMVNNISSFYKKKIICVLNGFDESDESIKNRILSKLATNELPLRIVYTGIIYKGRQDPTPLLNAISNLYSKSLIKKESVTVDFYGANCEVAKDLSRNLNFSPFIRLMGHVSREDALNAQRNAGLLLLLGPVIDVPSMFSSKLFEYMISGRPVLCIGKCPQKQIQDILSDTGIGIMIDQKNTQAIEKIIIEILIERRIKSIYNPNLDKILRYSRRVSSEFLLNEIKNDYLELRNVGTI